METGGRRYRRCFHSAGSCSFQLVNAVVGIRLQVNLSSKLVELIVCVPLNCPLPGSL